MSIAFVLDEHLRGRLWRAIQSHNARGLYPIDATRIGDPLDLPRGSSDPDILSWAESHGRIVVTRDQKTMPGHLANHLAAGHYSPGVAIIQPGCKLPDLVDHLVLATYASAPVDWENRYQYIP